MAGGGGSGPNRGGAVRIEVLRGDLVIERTDAIVNAANSALLGGGGVDGAIHAAAGPALLAECRELRRTTLPAGLAVGDAVATGAGLLAARWVIHTVGPNAYGGQTDPALLASCFTRSLEVAADVGARSVAFPAVSAGAYGWDVEDVARIAVRAVRAWSDGRPSDRGSGPDLVRFVLSSDRALAAFAANTARSGHWCRLAWKSRRSRPDPSPGCTSPREECTCSNDLRTEPAG